jgi:hypothetical protein
MNPTSKLEAVNTMLSAIGEAPVNSLSSGLVDAELAESILDATSRTVQSMGWHWNTEYNYKLSPLLDGTVLLPKNALRCDQSPNFGYNEFDLVMRGAKIYDRKNHTFTIGKTIEVDLVLALDFEEMPEAARQYTTIRAARVFQDRTVGSGELHGFQEKDEARALIDLKDAEADLADFTIFDNYSVSRVLDRKGN